MDASGGRGEQAGRGRRGRQKATRGVSEQPQAKDVQPHPVTPPRSVVPTPKAPKVRATRGKAGRTAQVRQRQARPARGRGTKGDVAGHEFHGNQWTGGRGGGEASQVGGGVAAIHQIGNVQQFLKDHPPNPGEKTFEYQSRIVQGLSPEAKHEMLFQLREHYPPPQYIVDGANRWRAEHGLPNPKVDISSLRAPLVESDKVGREFETRQDESNDPKVQAAFADFKRQNAEMYNFITKPEAEGGLGVKVDFSPLSKGDPYPSAVDQANDLRDNHHITIESGLGGDHTLMSTQEYDTFRAVHDTLGHTSIGSGFDRHGEYQAWLAHESMYTGEGAKAMSSEYHGVNTALWSGAPGTPGTGRSILLDDPLVASPWDAHGELTPARISAKAAPGPGPYVDPQTLAQLKDLADALGLDGAFASMFDHSPWHYEPDDVPADDPPAAPDEKTLGVKGDLPGHEFHGNQWTGGGGGEKPAATVRAETAAAKKAADARASGRTEAQARAVENNALSAATARQANAVLKANGVPRGAPGRTAYTHSGQALPTSRGGASGASVKGSSSGMQSHADLKPIGNTGDRHAATAAQHLSDAGFHVEKSRYGGSYEVHLPGRGPATKALGVKADASHLIDWFNAGADGQIDWGAPGSFDACVSIASNHMDDDEAKGFCANRHHDATGDWPGKGHKSGEVPVNDEVFLSDAEVLLFETLRAEVKGDVPGHEFHGNQWTGGSGGSGASTPHRVHWTDPSRSRGSTPPFETTAANHEEALRNFAVAHPEGQPHQVDVAEPDASRRAAGQRWMPVIAGKPLNDALRSPDYVETRHNALMDRVHQLTHALSQGLGAAGAIQSGDPSLARTKSEPPPFA